MLHSHSPMHAISLLLYLLSVSGRRVETLRLDRKMLLYPDALYSGWSQWGLCQNSTCLEIRWRKCRDTSFHNPITQLSQSDSCPFHYIIEERRCVDETECGRSETSPLLKSFSNRCGVRGSKVVTKILGGRPTQPHAWPWVAGLYIDHSVYQNNSPFCGATLIAPDWLITAAHCIESLSNGAKLPRGRTFNLRDYLGFGLKARLGDHNTRRYDRNEVEIAVESIQIHARYQPAKPEAGYDMALLRLRSTVSLGRGIQVACLLPDRGTRLPEGSLCHAAGWGETTSRPKTKQPSSSPKTHPPTLLQVALRLNSLDNCKKYVSELHEGVHICAGEPGKDTCQGDSGFGLYCQHPETGRWVLYGVTSFGSGDGCGKYPSVYTSVPGLSHWIHAQIQ